MMTYLFAANGAESRHFYEYSFWWRRFQTMSFYKKRGFRTLLLALFATATFVGSAIFMFDVDARVMLQLFLVSVVGLVLLMLAALVFTAIRILVRRWLGG